MEEVFRHLGAVQVYSQQVDRRRLEIARKVKERHGMVAKDFQAQVHGVVEDSLVHIPIT